MMQVVVSSWLVLEVIHSLSQTCILLVRSQDTSLFGNKISAAEALL